MHTYFFSDLGESRMEHERLPKERAQLGETLSGLRIWGAKLGLSGLQKLPFLLYHICDCDIRFSSSGKYNGDQQLHPVNTGPEK